MPASCNRVIAAVAALAVAASAAFFGYGAWQKKKLQSQVARLVSDAGARLEATLPIDINSPSPDLPKLDQAVEAADAALNELRSANGRRDPALVEAADDYVAEVFAVLKRQAGSARGRVKFVASQKALSAHIAQGGQRGARWLNDAVRLRQQLDRDYFDYQIAASSLVNMLGSYPQSRRKIAAELPGLAALPAESAIRDAQTRAQAALDATRQELEKAKQLVAPG